MTKEESGDLFIGDYKNRFVAEPQTSFSVSKLEKSIFNKSIWGGPFLFAKFHKLLSCRYRKFDFGYLKWSRMIPGTK